MTPSSVVPVPHQGPRLRAQRALRKLPPCADGQPSLYCVADRAVDEVSTYLLQPRTGSRVNRVCTYHQFNVAWAESPSSTRVRSEYSEDPMMPLPSWLLTYVTTKALPAGIEGLKKNAANFDERLQSQPAASRRARAALQPPAPSADLGHRRTGSKERRAESEQEVATHREIVRQALARRTTPVGSCAPLDAPPCAVCRVPCVVCRVPLRIHPTSD